MVKIKQKRAMEGGMWWIIIGGVGTLIMVGVVVWIVTGGLSRGDESIKYLSGCENQGGHCEKDCGAGDAKFYRLGGCPDDGDDEEDDVYCCIPKERQEQEDEEETN